MSATVIQPLPPRAAYTSEPIFKLTVDQYHELIRSGKITEQDPVELIDGILVFKMPKNARHSTSDGLLRRELERLLPPEWHYRAQEPVTLADGEPEPDGAVVRGRIEDYASAHPGPADVGLIIEIADTSVERDRGIKLRSYARAAIPTYWILNLVERRLESYSVPDGAADPPLYRRTVVFAPDSSVPVILAGRRVGDLRVGALLAQIES